MRVAVGLVLLLVAGCDASEATYPSAGSFPEVAPAAVAAAAPGRYNVTGVVTDVRSCPPAADCLGAEGIVLAAAPDASDGVFVQARQPQQLIRGARYRMSVEVRASAARVGAGDEPVQTVTLLGYDRL